MPGSPALYWSAIPYGSAAAESFADLFGAAQKAMAKAGLTGVTKSPTDVSGRSPNAHAAISFVGGTYESTTAVVMVAGDDAFAVRKKLVDALKSIKFL